MHSEYLPIDEFEANFLEFARNFFPDFRLPRDHVPLKYKISARSKTEPGDRKGPMMAASPQLCGWKNKICSAGAKHHRSFQRDPH